MSKERTEGTRGLAHDLAELRQKTQDKVTEEYQKTVEGILEGTIKSRDAVIVGYTPEIYKQLGMTSLPVVIGAGHVYSIAKTADEAKADGRYNSKTHYHGLGEAAVKDIYSKLQDPVMIIASRDVDPSASPLRSRHSVVAIVDIGQGTESLLMPIEITADRRVNGSHMDVNVLSSVYTRNVDSLIDEAIALENIGDVGIYYAKKEATDLIRAGVQFPKRIQERIASEPIIHRIDEKINREIARFTESSQFKRWLGDWQNRPKAASKVVDADGTPRVMYHGTNGGDFTVFDSSKSDKRVRLNALGDGYYFTETAERAEKKAAREAEKKNAKKPREGYYFSDECVGSISLSG